MIKVKIIDKNDYQYSLLDNSGKLYSMNIGFINVSNIPKVGDYLCLTKEMLEEVNVYTFGPLSNNVSDINSKDIIKVFSGADEFFLRRYYG